MEQPVELVTEEHDIDDNNAPLIASEHQKTRKSAIINYLLSHDKRFYDPLFAVVEQIQFLGLIWLFDFEQPYLYYQVTRFSLYFNLDFITGKLYIPNAAGIMSYPYPYYSVPWLFVIPVLLVFWRLSANRGEYLFSRGWLITERILHGVIRILLMPYFIYMALYGMCHHSGYGSSFCKNFTPAVSLLFLVVLVVTVVVLGFFYGKDVYRAGRRYSSGFLVTGKDEKWLQEISSLELEQALGLSSRYSLRRVHLVSSYKTPTMALYHLLYKSLLFRLLVIVLLVSIPSTYVAVQSGLLFFLTLVSCVGELTWNGFGWRATHSGIIYHVLQVATTVELFLIWIRCTGVRSPFLIDTTLGPLLITICCVSWFLCLLALPAMIIVFIKSSWHRWPVNSIEVQKVQLACSETIRDLMQSQTLISRISTSPSSWIWSKSTTDAMTYIRDHNLLPQYRLALQENGNHPLELMLENTISNLSQCLYKIEPFVMKNVVPQDVVDCLKANMDRRQRDFSLMSKRWSSAMIKVLAYNAFKDILDECKIRSPLFPQIGVDPPSPTIDVENKSPFYNVPTDVLRQQRRELKDWLKEFETRYENEYKKQASKAQIQAHMPKIYAIYIQYKDIEQELINRKAVLTPANFSVEREKEEW